MSRHRRDDKGRRQGLWSRLSRILQRRETHRDPRAAARQRRKGERALAQRLEEQVIPALEAARDHLESEGLAATVERKDHGVRLVVVRDEDTYCVYEVTGRLYHKASFSFPNLHGRSDRPQYPVLHIECDGLAHEWDLERCTYEAIHDDALEKCHKWLDW